jgi:hypothetical protein
MELSTTWISQYTVPLSGVDVVGFTVAIRRARADSTWTVECSSLASFLRWRPRLGIHEFVAAEAGRPTLFASSAEAFNALLDVMEREGWEIVDTIVVHEEPPG